MLKRYWLIILLLSAGKLIPVAFAQDAVFAIPNASYLYNNPGFGGTSGKLRFNNVFKNQHPLLPGNYNTNFLSVDQYMNGHGLGVYFLADEAGAASLRKLEFAGTYSYMIPINDKLGLSAGIGLGVGQSKLDLGQAIFDDQLQSDFSIAPVSNESFNGASTTGYAEVNAGFVLFHEQFWIGISGHHLNKPKIYTFAQDFRNDRKFGVQAGYKYKLKSSTVLNRNLEDKNLLFTNVEWTLQGSRMRILLSEKLYYNSIVGAVSLSHLNIEKVGVRSLLFGLGYTYQFVTLMYGYELYFKNISGVGGAHELHVNIAFNKDNNSSGRSFSNKKTMKTFCPLK